MGRFLAVVVLNVFLLSLFSVDALAGSTPSAGKTLTSKQKVAKAKKKKSKKRSKKTKRASRFQIPPRSPFIVRPQTPSIPVVIAESEDAVLCGGTIGRCLNEARARRKNVELLRPHQSEVQGDLISLFEFGTVVRADTVQLVGTSADPNQFTVYRWYELSGLTYLTPQNQGLIPREALPLPAGVTPRDGTILVPVRCGSVTTSEGIEVTTPCATGDWVLDNGVFALFLDRDDPRRGTLVNSRSFHPLLVGYEIYPVVREKIVTLVSPSFESTGLVSPLAEIIDSIPIPPGAPLFTSPRYDLFLAALNESYAQWQSAPYCGFGTGGESACSAVALVSSGQGDDPKFCERCFSDTFPMQPKTDANGNLYFGIYVGSANGTVSRDLAKAKDAFAEAIKMVNKADPTGRQIPVVLVDNPQAANVLVSVDRQYGDLMTAVPIKHYNCTHAVDPIQCRNGPRQVWVGPQFMSYRSKDEVGFAAAHELGHLFGLPDDYARRCWSIMNGSGMEAFYHKKSKEAGFTPGNIRAMRAYANPERQPIECKESADATPQSREGGGGAYEVAEDGGTRESNGLCYQITRYRVYECLERAADGACQDSRYLGYYEIESRGCGPLES